MTINTASLDAAYEISLETPADAAAIEALLNRAFGPGRFVKVSERLREGNRPLSDLCLTARSDGEVVGSVRLWPVQIGGAPCAFLGPLAVDPSRQGEGLGQALVAAACEAAASAGWPAVLLVGHPPFFAKVGFVQASTDIRLPGPVEARRLLIRALRDGGADNLAGDVVIDPASAPLS
ncbi:GNAT family N-acetyltransferase [Caulobacter sp. NIBR2454]|uniref:GNAT family N-acetyltransferase n=1 Tax=Caulobacter sp. NIBR2454 TaxID=3015996 RepID=UPI0022B72284|nr:N-acetyltransferase [Caulobacter sp. NIBR2454]